MADIAVDTKKRKQIEAVKDFLLPAYDFRLDYLEKRQDEIRREMNLNSAEIAKVKDLKEKVDHNLGRATAEDLDGVLFVFSGSTHAGT